jgi:hypothetical protein
MDPDMVRQQEEAEREALALLAKKKDAGPVRAGAVAVPYTVVADAHEPEAPEYREMPAAFEDAAIPAPEPRAGPQREREPLSIAQQMGRAISFGVAGAMLGGGLGIAATGYFGLPDDWARLVIFGPAAVLAGACAFASFYTKPTLE